MRKACILLLVVTMIAALTACGTNGNEPSDAAMAEEEKILAIVEAKDCFYDAGYVEFITGAEKAADYTFTAENSDGVNWRVYVFDEAFDDGYRYITQAAEPALEGDGTIPVTEGQFIYVHCSVNEFTADAANETAKLNVTVE